MILKRAAIISAAALVAGVISVPQASAAPFGLVGWATQGGGTTGGGTTGGGSAAPVTVTTAAAFAAAVGSSSAAVVRVSGTISLSSMTKVASNKTIEGVGSSAAITGQGLNISKVSNVIVRNLNFPLTHPHRRADVLLTELPDLNVLEAIVPGSTVAAERKKAVVKPQEVRDQRPVKIVRVLKEAPELAVQAGPIILDRVLRAQDGQVKRQRLCEATRQRVPSCFKVSRKIVERARHLPTPDGVLLPCDQGKLVEHHPVRAIADRRVSMCEHIIESLISE